jgi:DNA-binding GntR family transcriptional regulator
MRSRPVIVSSVDLVYQQTRAAILNGDYPPGTALKIQDLAAANAVSLTPVREALRLLAAEGFVDTVRNHSARVAPVSELEAVEIYSLRVLLETEAVRRGFARITPEVLARLRKLNQDLIRADHRDDEFAQMHRAFHFAIYELSNSKWLERMIGLLWAHGERHRWLVCAQDRQPYDKRAHHTELLAALEQPDVDAVVVALRNHIEHNLSKLLEAGGQDPVIT